MAKDKKASKYIDDFQITIFQASNGQRPQRWGLRCCWDDLKKTFEMIYKDIEQKLAEDA